MPRSGGALFVREYPHSGRNCPSRNVRLTSLSGHSAFLLPSDCLLPQAKADSVNNRLIGKFVGKIYYLGSGDIFMHS
jgi:hypothetical protein